MTVLGLASGRIRQGCYLKLKSFDIFFILLHIQPHADAVSAGVECHGGMVSGPG